MLKQVFRLTFITFVWKHYKRVIVSTLLFFATLWFIGFAHEEYLAYATLQDAKQHIGVSFVLKWLAILASTACYLFYHWLSRKKVSQPVKNKTEQEVENDKDDPFAEIRRKKKLRSRAEIMLEKNQPKD